MPFEGITGPIYGTLDILFGWLFKLTPNQEFNMLFGILVISTIISSIIILVTSKVVDQEKMKKCKEKMKRCQEKMKEAQKKGDVKKTKKIQRELMETQSYMMKNSFRPMLYTMPPIFLIFGWLYHMFPRDQVVAHLPFSLPHWGSTLGWLGWYILCSFATSALIKKIFNIEGP